MGIGGRGGRVVYRTALARCVCQRAANDGLPTVKLLLPKPRPSVKDLINPDGSMKLVSDLPRRVRAELEIVKAGPDGRIRSFRFRELSFARRQVVRRKKRTKKEEADIVRRLKALLKIYETKTGK